MGVLLHKGSVLAKMVCADVSKRSRLHIHDAGGERLLRCLWTLVQTRRRSNSCTTPTEADIPYLERNSNMTIRYGRDHLTLNN